MIWWQFCHDYFSQSASKWRRWRWTMSGIRSSQCWPSIHQVYNIQYNTFSQLIICIFSWISWTIRRRIITSSELCLIFCTLMFGVVVFCHEIWNKIQHGLISYCFLHDKKALLQYIGVQSVSGCCCRIFPCVCAFGANIGGILPHLQHLFKT